MTVSSTSSRVVYAGNGSTTVFPFAFKVAQAADLVVVHTDAAGDDIALSPSQYAASGFGLDAGGAVTYPAPDSGNPPIASGTRLTLYRDVAMTQPTSISNQGAMWPQVIESALDRLTCMVQRVSDTVSRALVVPATDPGGALDALPAAAMRANAVLAFDADGQPRAAALDAGVVAWSSWIVDSWRTVASAAAGRSVLSAVGLTETGTFDITGGRARVPTRTDGDDGPDAASTAFVQAAIDSALDRGPFTTGDIKLTWKATADAGWILHDDGTIGDAASAATCRANADTQALFTLIRATFDDTLAPVSGGRGANAAADFAAHKTIRLPLALGRAVAVAGAGSGLTARALGETAGSETHDLTLAENSLSFGNTTPSTGGGNVQGVADNTGGNTPFSVMQPTAFWNVMIKL